MNTNYRYTLITKLYKLRDLYLNKKGRINSSEEKRLYEAHVLKVIEFYERNKSRELLYFLLKSKKYTDINTLLTNAEHIARQTSEKRRKIVANACLKGIDYTTLYIISNQSSTNAMKYLLKIYYSNNKNKDRILREEKEKILKRFIRI